MDFSYVFGDSFSPKNLPSHINLVFVFLFIHNIIQENNKVVSPTICPQRMFQTQKNSRSP